MSDRVLVSICILILVVILVGITVLMCMPNDGRGLKAIINIPGYNAPVIVRLKNWDQFGTMYKITSTDGTVYRADQKNVLLVKDGGE